jgi:hypothetical protein
VEQLPAPCNLGAFWSQVEGAVRSLHNSLADLGLLGPDEMRQLVPVILGTKGWQHYQQEAFGGWVHFKRVVTKEFGLSAS